VAASVVVSSGYGILDNAAKEAVQQWEFAPALDNGSPVQGHAKAKIVFRLT